MHSIDCCVISLTLSPDVCVDRFLVESKHCINVVCLSFLFYYHRLIATGHSGASASKRRQLAPTGLLSSKSSHELYGISSIPKAALVSNGGRPKIATITRVSGRKQMISWVDAPDDVFFIANATTKQIRKQLPQSELRKGARKPWRRVGGKQHSNINTNNGNNNHTNGDSTNGTSLVRSNNNNDISQTV